MALDRINATALLDGGVTTADIADDAVTTAKLATQTGNVDFADGGRIRLGDSQDLQIYHDGSASRIDDAGTGDLILRSSSIQLQKYTGETMAGFVADGAVTLRYDNALKLATTNIGIEITGTVTADDITLNDASPTITLTDSDGPYTGVVRQNGSNTEIKNEASGNIRFFTGSNEEALRITGDKDIQILNGSGTAYGFFDASTQRLGLGTSSPSFKLAVEDGTGATRINVRNTANAVPGSGIYFEVLSGASVVGNGTIATQSNGDMAFFTGTSSGPERMRISNEGHLLVGIQSNVTNGSEGVEIRSDYGYIKTGRNTTGSSGHILFFNSNGNVGSITTVNSSTAYNTSSDYRLKENVDYTWDATTRLKQLKPARFNFIADADTTVDGFLAHEVQSVVPEAITGTKDGMRDEEYEVTPATGDIYTPAVAATYDDDGVEVTAATDEVIHSADVERPEELEEGQQWRETTAAVMGTRSVPDYQGIDQGKLVPLLVKSLQEALDKIDTLETRLEALENA